MTLYASLSQEQREKARERTRRWRAAHREQYNATERARRRRSPEKVQTAYNKWRSAHLEQEQARSRRYRAKHRKAIQAMDRQRYAGNPEYHHEKNRAYYARNSEKRKHDRREWGARNPDKQRALSRKRRARKFRAGGSHSIDDIRAIKKAQRSRCAGCAARLNNRFQVDHIVPLAKGGSDDRRNLQLLCAGCNRRKKDSDPAKFYRRMGRLL